VKKEIKEQRRKNKNYFIGHLSYKKIRENEMNFQSIIKSYLRNLLLSNSSPVAGHLSLKISLKRSAFTFFVMKASKVKFSFSFFHAFRLSLNFLALVPLNGSLFPKSVISHFSNNTAHSGTPNQTSFLFPSFSVFKSRL
jgi:hypothetical protein